MLPCLRLLVVRGEVRVVKNVATGDMSVVVVLGIEAVVTIMPSPPSLHNSATSSGLPEHNTQTR